VKCDVSKEGQVNRLFDLVMRDYGRLDILFNNAGIAGEKLKLEEFTLKEWQRVLSVNLTSVFLCTKEAIKIMRGRKYGKIINISSILGFVGGFPVLMIPPYNAAKGAIISFTREVALQYANDGIRVNSIAPGFFFTNIGGYKDPDFCSAVESLIPMGEIAQAEDLKGTAVFLASQASDYITGSVICIDGGYTAK
jgi:NAD(P)-dependent dehydrogenase (short-subunit alcohol dehydrogenase family)